MIRPKSPANCLQDPYFQISSAGKQVREPKRKAEKKEKKKERKVT
jgi:hypothetical protein